MITKLLLLLCLVFCLFSSVGFCSATYTLTEEQKTTLEENLTQLQNNNEILKSLLNQSKQELITASVRSENLNSQIQILEEQLTQSSNQIQQLKSQLTMFRQQTNQAQQSLKITSAELENVNKSFDQYAKEQKRIESQLKTQKNIWEGIAAISLGYAIVK